MSILLANSWTCQQPDGGINIKKEDDIMIKEAFVSCDIAKRLKEKGFNEECFGYYNSDGQIDTSLGKWRNDDFIMSHVAAPTQQMAMRWLREAKGIFIKIDMDGSGYYNFNVYLNGSLYSTGEEMDFETYELAVAFGLLFVLTKMEL